jgi:hypothetical protein
MNWIHGGFLRIGAPIVGAIRAAGAPCVAVPTNVRKNVQARVARWQRSTEFIKSKTDLEAMLE